jgi:hypothetical protein
VIEIGLKVAMWREDQGGLFVVEGSDDLIGG